MISLPCLDVWLQFHCDISICRPVRVAYFIKTSKLISIFIYLNSFATPNDRIIWGLCVFFVCFFVLYLKRKFEISVQANRTSSLLLMEAWIRTRNWNWVAISKAARDASLVPPTGALTSVTAAAGESPRKSKQCRNCSAKISETSIP